MANTGREDNSHYISLSDMMTALMLIFLFVAVSVIQYTTRLDEEHDPRLREAREYIKKKDDLYKDLEREFSRDLRRWDADISPDLSVRFSERAAQFNLNEAELRPEFQQKLSEFFPRYIKIIRKYEGDIKEIRIEGHTDSTGPCRSQPEGMCVVRDGPYKIVGNYTNNQKDYLYNMALSQARAKNVLAYCLTLTSDFDYMKKYVTANGLSSSNLITKSGREDKAASRRVEFRVLLRADESIEKFRGGK